MPYQDLGGDYFARRADPERIAKRLVAQLERLGHTVTLQTSTAQSGSQPDRDFLSRTYRPWFTVWDGLPCGRPAVACSIALWFSIGRWCGVDRDGA